ncbi:MAG TPA: glycine cleavage system protein GcvH [Acholeplasmataceae bacterium]|jgi:glycine cleavage system H protein|nr:glycine cleavage system protein GcvH [Acholeplasmataceae bacterium]
MSKVLENLLYSKSHEWCLVEGGVAKVGLTDYAQDSLGSVVYLDAGEVGDKVKQFAEFGAVESVKAASDLMAPVSGEIVEVNQEVLDNPELLNSDPYGHWIVKIKVSDEKELDNLLDAKGYRELLE